MPPVLQVGLIDCVGPEPDLPAEMVDRWFDSRPYHVPAISLWLSPSRFHLLSSGFRNPTGGHQHRVAVARHTAGRQLDLRAGSFRPEGFFPSTSHCATNNN